LHLHRSEFNGVQCTSIVLGGMLLFCRSDDNFLFGLLLRRVLAGTSNFVSLRNIYWTGVGLQVFVFILLYFTLPDLQAKQKNLRYHQILYSMGRFILTEPLTLVYSMCLTRKGMLAATVFAYCWTTRTFLRRGDLYNCWRYPSARF
jgi:hypothetical protein